MVPPNGTRTALKTYVSPSLHRRTGPAGSERYVRLSPRNRRALEAPVLPPWLPTLALLALIALYVVWIGQNWSTYAGALMVAAIGSDHRRHAHDPPPVAELPEPANAGDAHGPATRETAAAPPARDPDPRPDPG